MVRYPIRALIRFNHLAHQRRVMERIQTMNAFRSAMHADKKQYKKLLDELQDG